MTSNWNNGAFTSSTLATQTMIGNSSVTNYTSTEYSVFLGVSSFTWAPGKVMWLRATPDLFVSTPGPMLFAMVEANNTGLLLFALPADMTDIVVYDAGQMTGIHSGQCG